MRHLLPLFLFIAAAYANPVPQTEDVIPVIKDEIVSRSDASDVLPNPSARSSRTVEFNTDDGAVWLPFAPVLPDEVEGKSEVVTVIPTELEEGEVVTVHEPKGLDDKPPPKTLQPNAEDETAESGHGVLSAVVEDIDDKDEEAAASEMLVREETTVGEDYSEEQQHPMYEAVQSEEQHGEEMEEEEEEIETSSPDNEAEVKVSEWMPPTTTPADKKQDGTLEETENNEADQEDENDVISRANAVSAPWADAMVAGLPPAVAYDWQFLFNIASKIKSASFNGASQGGYNARLKYILSKLRDEVARTKLDDVKLDVLKHQHQLKAKLDAAGYHDDALRWAWRRAVPLQ